MSIENYENEKRETIQQATKILVHLIDSYNGDFPAEELQSLARNACREILDAALVNDLSGCPLCQS